MPAVGEKPLFVPGPTLPSWEALSEKLDNSEAGKLADANKKLWAAGEGPPHTDTLLRLFGTTGEPRVVFYRDTAAWCPYCQKTWLLLEEKKIPYRVEKINMRSYGEKPAWYLNIVPSGLLPAISLDGRLVTESIVIMQLLDRTFTGETHRPMMPPPNADLSRRADQLLRLERELFGWWCQVVFRPGGDRAQKALEQTLDQVDQALGDTPGPWFLGPFAGADEPSMVDLTYVPHIERMAASLLYWRGLRLRGNPRWPNLQRWFDALEQRPSYMASRSDWYTHVRDIPPQYGEGFFGGAPGTEAAAATIAGEDGSWSLPLKPLNGPEADAGFDGLGPLEPVLPQNDPGPAVGAQMAALRLVRNRDAVVRFACRGVGTNSGWGSRPGRAALSDPNAVPNDAVASDVDAALRAVAAALLAGETAAAGAALAEATAAAGGSAADRSARAAAVARCVEYLRDRVGVPRDMPLPAARQLRAHLNWARDVALGCGK